jgi:hypothetical protein
MKRQNFLPLVIILIFLSGCVRNASVSGLKPTVQDNNSFSTPEIESGQRMPASNPDNKTKTINKDLFASAKIIGTGFVEGEVFTIIMELNNRVTGNFRAVFGQEKYECIQQESFPNRLYCSGKPINNTDNAEFVLYTVDGSEVLFRTTITIPKE